MSVNVPVHPPQIIGIEVKLVPVAAKVSVGKSSKSLQVILLFSTSITSVLFVPESLDNPVVTKTLGAEGIWYNVGFVKLLVSKEMQHILLKRTHCSSF